MAFSLGSIGAPRKEIAHLPWRERDRIEQAAHKRMFSEYGVWLGLAWGVQLTSVVIVLVLQGYSSSLEPTARAQFFPIVLPLMIFHLVSIAATTLLMLWASRRAFRGQMAEEGLVTPIRAPEVQGCFQGGHGS